MVLVSRPNACRLTDGAAEAKNEKFMRFDVGEEVDGDEEMDGGGFEGGDMVLDGEAEDGKAMAL